MMRIVILGLLVAWTTGDRELFPSAIYGDSLSKLLNDSSYSYLLSDPDLWLILKKRFGNTNARNECNADKRQNNVIIKTKDSLEAGATFITAPSVRSDKDCENECCKEKSCNTAVIKIKGGHSEEFACYLFDCKNPSVCIFTSHPGFMVLEYSSFASADEHADDLDHLAVSSAATTTSSTTISTTLSTTTTTKATRAQNSHGRSPAGLFNECHQTSDCRDQNTDCLSGYCVCQRGYHAVELKCRKDCHQELEFECANKNSPLTSECIAVYDRCDGTTQCSDGSDESSCVESSRHRGSEPETHEEQSRVRPVGLNKGTSTASPTSLAVSSKPDLAVASVGTTVTKPLPVNISQLEVAKTSAPARASSTHRNSSPVESKQETLSQDVNDEVKQEKVERYFWRMETNRGAVVALVLGIILTTALLVMAGCRLRHFRKRYRKGRLLNSNEPDYLINGMYL